jgi:hypothetical protein
VRARPKIAPESMAGQGREDMVVGVVGSDCLGLEETALIVSIRLKFEKTLC